MHHYAALPFFPLTPFDFNHLLISLVAWRKTHDLNLKLPRSEDRGVTLVYKKEYRMCRFHRITKIHQTGIAIRLPVTAHGKVYGYENSIVDNFSIQRRWLVRYNKQYI